MSSQNQRAARLFTITIIAAFQGALACYLIYFVVLACLNPAEGLGSLRSALRLLIGRTDYRSYSGCAHEVIAADLFFFSLGAIAVAVYSLVTSWGLWRLKKWARHSVAGICGIEVIRSLRGFLYFGAAGGFSRIPQSTLQSVYIVIFIEAMIFMTLTFSGGVSESFGEVE